MIGEIKRSLRYHAIRLFRMQGSKEKMARGFAIGMAFNFFPTFGLGAFISGFVARLFGGNMIAGFIGGSTLAIFWPILFYLNMKVGGVFLRPAVMIDDLGDVTPQTINALVWGQTFAIGSLLNSVIFGVAAYFIFLLAYERIKTRALRGLQRQIRGRRAPDLSEGEASSRMTGETSNETRP